MFQIHQEENHFQEKMFVRRKKGERTKSDFFHLQLLMSSTLQGLSSYAFGGSSASCDGNGLPPHLAFLSDFLERVLLFLSFSLLSVHLIIFV